jgi:hypothetical protein
VSLLSAPIAIAVTGMELVVILYEVVAVKLVSLQNISVYVAHMRLIRTLTEMIGQCQLELPMQFVVEIGTETVSGVKPQQL